MRHSRTVGQPDVYGASRPLELHAHDGATWTGRDGVRARDLDLDLFRAEHHLARALARFAVDWQATESADDGPFPPERRQQDRITIILAVGVTQSWRPAFVGTGLALAVLALLVLIFGPLLGSIPIEAMQLVIGTLLILFGLRWLRKAILRASGFFALHDEEKAFVGETAGLRQLSRDGRADFLAEVAAFKAVLLKGIEVVFIVITTGAGRGMIGYASLGALAACVLVLAIGFVVHKPLSTVPENSLKFVVGLILSAFGIFWAEEGFGAEWPGADLSLLAIFGVLSLFSFLAVSTLRRRAAMQTVSVTR